MRRPALHRDGVSEGRNSQASSRPRPLETGSVDGTRVPDCRRAGRRACGRDSSSRYQAGQHLHYRARTNEDSGFRPRESDARKEGAALSSGQPARKWRRAKVLVPTVVLMVAAVVAVVFLRAPRAAALTDRDVILLADLENKTGDPVFDDTLKTMLAAQLEQSPFFNLLPEERIRQPLRY